MLKMLTTKAHHSRTSGDYMAPVIKNLKNQAFEQFNTSTLPY